MKKGFTLIELLAVIVILAIIAVIAVPIVIKVIEETKINSIKSSAKLYLKSAELFISNAELNKIKIPYGTYSIMADGNICIGTIEENKCNGQIIKIEIKGNKPNSGKIIIDKKRIQIDYLEIEGYNCYQEKTNYNCKKAGNINIETTDGLIVLEKSKAQSLSNYKIYGNSIKNETVVIENLPSEYQQVEYIESTGTQYIDTKLYLKSEYDIEFKFSTSSFATSESTSYKFFTSDDANKDKTWHYSANLGSQVGEYKMYGWKFSGDKYTVITHSWLSLNTPYVVKTIGNDWYIGENKFINSGGNITEGGKTSPITLRLFAGNEPFDVGNLKMYYFKVLNGQELIANIIPCYRKSDKTVGMYDTVSGEFYTNSGTGNFLKGENVESYKSVGDYDASVQKYKIPVEVSGKNLFDINNTSAWKQSIYYYYPIYVGLNKKVTISWDNDLSEGQDFYLCVGTTNSEKGNGNSTGGKWLYHTSNSNLRRKAITVTTNTEGYIYINMTPKNLDKLIKLQVEYGSEATEYEPYAGKIYNIYIDQPLRCLEEVCDYVDFARGKVVRNVEIVNSELIKLEKSCLEDIELPEININKGVSNIFIETQVKPSKFNINYNE